jgi:biotin carboxyl carrier protein
MKTYNITVNGQTYVVTVEEVAGGAAAPVAAAPVIEAKKPVAAAPAAPKAAPAPAAGGKVKVTAPMPGNIVKVCVSAGAAVKKGDVLCVLEAMKMENEIKAPEDGTVASVAVNSGASVSSGDVLVTLD